MKFSTWTRTLYVSRQFVWLEMGWQKFVPSRWRMDRLPWDYLIWGRRRLKSAPTGRPLRLSGPIRFVTYGGRRTLANSRDTLKLGWHRTALCLCEYRRLVSIR